MKQFVSKIKRAVVLLCAGGLLACAQPSEKPGPEDGVSGATPTYAAGDRGALPPAWDGYEVLGVKEGIKNWVIRYDEVLIRGGEFYDDKASEALQKWGVTTIVSITPNDKEREFSRKFGFVLVEVPFEKSRGPAVSDVNRFLDTIRSGKGPFYLHCVGGTHRAGVLGVAYRVHVLGWAWERALVEFGRLGGDLKENHAMLEVIRKYQPR